MKKYHAILNILLITIAVYFSVKTFYKVTTAQLDQVLPPSADTKQTASLKDATHHPLSYYRAIIERNLFNTKTGAGRQPEKIKHTKCDLNILRRELRRF